MITGTINNSFELRKELIAQGVVMKSETDTEVIAMLVGIGMDEGLDSKSALQKALSRCDGSWGIAMIDKSSPSQIVAACNGAPMVIGLGGSGKKYIASETTAFRCVMMHCDDDNDDNDDDDDDTHTLPPLPLL